MMDYKGEVAGIPVRWYQELAVHKVRECVAQGKRRIIFCAPTGCHRKGQKILMFDGSLKSVEDIAVGEKLMGPDSKPRTVIELCRGKDKMFSISPTKGEPFVVNSKHILSLQRTPTKKGDPRTAGVVDVSVEEWLNWNNHQKHIHKLFRVAVEFPVKQQHAVDPYFVGVLIGDGCLSRGMSSVSKPDKEIVDELHLQAKKFGLEVTNPNPGDTSSTYSLINKNRVPGQYNSNPLTAELRRLGISGVKCEDKFVPHEYKISSTENRLQILAGLLDTDGHLGSGSYDFISKSKTLADDVVFLARSVGLAAYATKTVKGCQNGFFGEYHRVSISGNLDVIPCRIPRKKAGARLQKKNVLVTGFTVNPLGEEEFYGFTLDGDGRYVMGDFTVTHNSGKTRFAIAIMASSAQKGFRCLFLAHARELIDQCSASMKEFGLRHGIIMTGHGYTRADIQLGSKDTILSRAIRSEKIDLPGANVVIFDEAHISMARCTNELLQRYPKAVIIGITATPTRTDGRGLSPFYEAIVQTVTIPQLISEGYLVPVKVYTHDRPDLKGIKTARGDYVKKDLAKRMDKPELVGNLVEHWKRLAEDRLTFSYAVNIKHSHHIRDEFLRAGIRAEHVDGKTEISEREDIFGRFADGKTRILCTVGVAVVGVDIPQAACCLSARPTKSVIVARQSWGRIMRPYPGKPNALLLDHAGNVFRHGFPDDNIEWVLEQDRNVNDKIKEDQENGKMRKPIECPRCRHVFSGTNICPECGYELPSRERGKLIHRKNGVLVMASDGGEEYKQDIDALRRMWTRALGIAASKKGTLAMAAAIFKNDSGRLPWQVPSLPYLPSTPGKYNERVTDLFPQFDRKRG